MCPLCHADADEKGTSPGAYSKEDLRALKKAPRSSDDVRGHFPTWQDKKSLLVRVGGVYTDAAVPILVNEIPQIRLGKSAAGLLSLTFELRNRDDEILVKMEDNWFTACPQNVHDMTVTPKTKEVTVWLSEDDVGLQFSFRRLTVRQLDELLDQDWKRSEELAAKRLQEALAQLSPRQRALREAMMDDLSGAAEPSWVAGLSQEMREAYVAKDKTAHGVKRWAKEHCVMDDGTIPLLDFEQLAIYFHGQRFMIKDGVADFLYYSAIFGNASGAINLACQCADCLSMRQPLMTDKPRWKRFRIVSATLSIFVAIVCLFEAIVLPTPLRFLLVGLGFGLLAMGLLGFLAASRPPKP
jgi:hypothetical protein